jgi:hypothetical protein
VVVGLAGAGIPASSAARKPSRTAGSSPDPWVVIVIVPADTCVNLSSANRVRAGLSGALLAARYPP